MSFTPTNALHGSDMVLTIGSTVMECTKATPSPEMGDDEITNSKSKRARETAPTIGKVDLDIECIYNGDNAPTFVLGSNVTCSLVVGTVNLFTGLVMVKSMKTEVMVDGAVKYSGTLLSQGPWTGTFAPTFPA